MRDNSKNGTETFISHPNKNYENLLISETGTFYVDDYGIVQCFEPAHDNLFFEERTEKNANYIFKTDRSIRTFVVPKGVKGFVSDFMRDMHIIERLEFPDGLLSIGNNTHDLGKIDAHCVFADCLLPEVVIPDSVKEIGSFAFGHSYIDSLQLPESLHSPYGRQFKDSYIGTLILPKEWKDGVSLGKYGELHLTGWWFDDDKFGYLRWPSTKIGKLEFY